MAGQPTLSRAAARHHPRPAANQQPPLISTAWPSRSPGHQLMQNNGWPAGTGGGPPPRLNWSFITSPPVPGQWAVCGGEPAARLGPVIAPERARARHTFPPPSQEKVPPLVVSQVGPSISGGHPGLPYSYTRPAPPLLNTPW